MIGDPHGGGRLVRGRASLDEAAGVVVLLHGRGATAEAGGAPRERVALSGGLIGARPAPPDADAAPLRALGRTCADKAFDYGGSLAGVPAFAGCSDVAPHIPLARVERTAAVLRSLGADVRLRVYPGFGHTVNADEVAAARAVLDRAVPAQGGAA